MKGLWFRITLLVSIVLLLAACSPAGAPALPEDAITHTAKPPATNTESENTMPTPESNMTQPASSSGMDRLVEAAKEDLAQRLSIPIEQVELIEAKEVTWPDASLGCPQPGMAYIQVPQDGAKIVLQAGGKLYNYHSGGNRGVFLCEQVYKDPNTPPKIDLNDLTLYMRDGNDPSSGTPDNSIPPGEDQ